VIRWVAVIVLALYVVDGDTIRLDGERIRIVGLDAPETRLAKCESERSRGYAAKAALLKMLKGQELDIKRQGIDRYGRTLAVVRVHGRNVAHEMIRAGHARAYWGGRRKGWCD